MSPRIIHIPLSGGDRKAQAKGIRQAHGIHASHYRQSVLIAAPPRPRSGKPTGWNAMPGTPSCGRAAPRCPRPANHRRSRPSARPSTAATTSWRPSAIGATGSRWSPPAISEAPTGDAGLEAGGGAVLRALQRGTALQPPPARTHPRADLCPARSRSSPRCPAARPAKTSDADLARSVRERPQTSLHLPPSDLRVAPNPHQR
jgi:hypothetical protein